MKQNKFYLKKIGQRGNIAVWQVDGNLIRSKLEKEFTNFGQHYRFFFIPEHEFWLDKEADPDEKKFFIEHLLTEWRLMRNGKSYNYAIRKADKAENAERIKAGDATKAINRQGNLDIKKIHKKFINQAGELLVWLIDGRLVRSILDVDFTEGGHNLVYDFVPKNEIWIDDDLSAQERPFVILHELYERSRMARGLAYNQAHKKASQLEWECRHNEKKLAGNLAKLGFI